MTGAGSECGRERLARAALTRLAEPGDALLGAWVDRAGADAVWQAVRHGHRPARCSPDRWAGIRARAARACPEEDLARAAAAGGRLVCPDDREWPRQLDDLGPARPVALWVRGAPSLRFLALRSVAVVGARACTEYGGQVAADLAAALAGRGWTVVSGAAYGIDGAAHRAALARGGATVAVLACGIDVGYPAGHRGLLERIAGEGLVVSELPPGERPTRPRFLQRNRVLAALTRGTVVVEAALRSGALVTARHAAQLGRQVMGVAGSVYSSQSQGVHRLLRGEGQLVTDADEVIELTGDIGELAPAREGPAVARDLLSPAAARVLEAVPVGGGTRADIARGACTGEESAGARLLELHALGFVERRGEGWRVRARQVCPRSP